MNQLFSVYEHDPIAQKECILGTRYYYPKSRLLTFTIMDKEVVEVGSLLKIGEDSFRIIGTSFHRNWYGSIKKASISVVKEKLQIA